MKSDAIKAQLSVKAPPAVEPIAHDGSPFEKVPAPKKPRAEKKPSPKKARR